VVCVGGGHCNVQVLKTLKQLLPATAKLTLITDNGLAFYSGMLPGAVSKLYTPE
jgi:NADH dehydrogenase FAD-containing subunit